MENNENPRAAEPVPSDRLQGEFGGPCAAPADGQAEQRSADALRLPAAETPEEDAAAEQGCADAPAKPAPEGDAEPAAAGKKASFLQFLKFVGFSCSAGVIQLLSFELLYNWIGWKQWWAAYLISLTLSVLWNFTFNRKFTFKSAGNVPLAMGLVILYYCAFTPVSVLGGDALEGIGWNGTLVTVLMMLANFLTEFVWDKFVVFNDPLLKKIFRRRGRKQ